MNHRYYRVQKGLLLLLIACAAALIAGCGSGNGGAKDSGIVGKWTDPTGKTTIMFSADQTFTQDISEKSITGKWAVKDKKLTLSILTIGGRPIEEAIDEQVKLAAKNGPTPIAPDQIAKAKQQMIAQSKAMIFTLGADGKSMSLDGAPEGAGAKLTKAEDN